MEGSTVLDKPVVGMEGSTVLAEVGSMVLAEVGSTARGLALGTAGNTPAGDKLVEGELVHEQAHAGVEVVGQDRDCKAEVQDKAQGIAGDRAGRPAAGILAQDMVEDMAQGMVGGQARGTAEDKAQGIAGGTAGILADTRALGLVQQQALGGVQE